MEDKIIKFSIPKEQAIKVAKRAIAGKIAIQKDQGDYFEAGVKPIPPINPGMLVTVKVNNDHLALNKKGMGGQLLEQAAFMIQDALDEAANAAPAAPAQPAPQPIPHNAAPVEAKPQTSQAAVPNKEAKKTINLDEKAKVFALLKELKELKDAGILTDKEFTAQKKELLAYSSLIDSKPISKPISVQEPTSEQAAEEESSGESATNEQDVEEAPAEEVAIEPVPQGEPLPPILYKIQFTRDYFRREDDETCVKIESGQIAGVVEDAPDCCDILFENKVVKSVNRYYFKRL